MNNDIKCEDDVVEIESMRGVGVWNENIESYLISLMEEEVKRGNRPTTTLIKQAWRTVKQKLKEKTKRSIRCKDFSKLLQESRIVYNPVTYQLSVEDAVSKRLYEKGCKHSDKLSIIFGDTTATGSSSHASTISLLKGPKTKKRKLNVNHKKLRERVNTAMADALVAMSGHQSKEDHDLLMECIDTLSALDGIDGASFAKATKLIHDDPLWRKMLLRFLNDRKRIIMDLDIKDILSDSDNEDFQQLMAIYINLQNNGFLKNKPRLQRISKLTGHQYVLELLNGHPMTCYDLLRMTPQILINSSDELKKG
ncbi:L10-interacting MYB domain-containing protein [Bienertia sinuspersici]